MTQKIDSRILTREDPSQEICTREVAIMPSSINEGARTVRAAIATPTPARVYHYDVGRVIEEILVPGGMMPVDQVPLISMHDRFSPESVLGSVENFSPSDAAVEATLRFGTDLGDWVESIWNRVKQRHLRSVSAGYEAVTFTDIQPGQTATVNGRSYTAKKEIMLRVTTKWRVREVSIVVVPADENARIRSDNGAAKNSDEIDNSAKNGVQHLPSRNNVMGLLAYLAGLGLQADADATAIRSFVGGLNTEQRAHALTLAATPAERAYFETVTPVAAAGAQRADAMQVLTGAAGGDGSTAGDAVSHEAIRNAERTRVIEIGRLGAGVSQDLVNRAISEGWSVDRSGREFLTSIQAGSSQPVGHGGHVGIHSRSQSTEINLAALQVGFAMRCGVEPDAPVLSLPGARAMLSRSDCNASWMAEAGYALRSGNAADDASRAIDIASRRIRRMSIPDIAAHCLRMAGMEVPEDREDMIRRAYTTNQFSAVFTTNFSVRLLMGYMEFADTTSGWVMEEDLPDFTSHDLVQSDPMGMVRKKVKNVPGQQVDASDRKESYAAERFVGTQGFDEVDMINDRLRAFQQSPRKLGMSAARIRPNLVYAILLNNPTLAADSVELFATAHGNLVGSAALGSATLIAAEAAMALQTRNGANLDITATHLIVPRTKRATARRLVGSDVMDDPTNTAEYGTMNPNKNAFTVVAEARLDSGFQDPDDPKSTIAGQPNSWFLADAKNPGIVVGYVEGSGRAPKVRSRVKNSAGEYGMDWDVCLDIGVGVADYPALLKRQSASL